MPFVAHPSLVPAIHSKRGQDTRSAPAHNAGMNSPRPSGFDAMPAVIAWIEQHIDQPLTLEQIAAQAGWSPYHFSRLFTARMGRSVMSHVRGRRLVRSARRLCDEPDLKLVDLAFDCGFESQEAFTRAFKRLFGTSPGRFRNGFAVEPLEGQYPMALTLDSTSSVVQLPELVHKPAFRVAGACRRFDEASKAQIPQLWTSLIGALPFPGQSASWATYGVVFAADRAEGSFEYMAGVGIEADAALPPGFAPLDIPSATYLVYRITLDGTAVHPQVKRAMAQIWNVMIPATGLTLAGGPDFELYDGRFDPQKPGSIIDFHVPVIPPAPVG